MSALSNRQDFSSFSPKEKNISSSFKLRCFFQASTTTKPDFRALSRSQKKEIKHIQKSEPWGSRKPETACGEFPTTKARPARPAYREELPPNRLIWA
jgi:hypothetical protein